MKKKEKLIYDDLIEQLEQQGKFSKFYTDLAKDYVYFYALKNKLQKDIKENGIRYEVTNGNGFTSIKPNESILNLQKVNGQMLKILSELKLQTPAIVDSGDADDYL